LTKKLALITGSTQGIGFEIAHYLANHNYRVVINGRNETTVLEICSTIGSATIPFTYDFLEFSDCESALKKIVEQNGVLDLIVSNVGSGRFPIDYLNANINSYIDCFNINLFQCINLFNSSFDVLNPSGSQLMSISSIAGCEDIGAPIAYQSAKAALLTYMKSLSRHCAQDNIRVNCISPGNVFIEGGLWDNKLKENERSVKNYIKENVPMNTFVNGEDIAKTVLFLENNSSITGENIVVDAGQTHRF
jgi:3-oxoacyl-[acyl-carrier protein] reductase